jgi:hypothetical protein
MRFRGLCAVGIPAVCSILHTRQCHAPRAQMHEHLGTPLLGQLPAPSQPLPCTTPPQAPRKRRGSALSLRRRCGSCTLRQDRQFYAPHGYRELARTLRRLFKLAGVRGTAHCFGDTFAVELLLAGVSTEEVAVLLGHCNIGITQKHHSPGVHSRRRRLEANLERAWNCDPIVLLNEKTSPKSN